MSVSIDKPAFFQSYLNKQRKDKFVMVFSLPPALKVIMDRTERKNNAVIPNTIQFSIYGSVVPDISIPEKEVPFGGQVMKVSSMARPSFPKNTVNFTIDNMFNNYWVIYKWLQMFNDERDGIYKSPMLKDQGLSKNYNTIISVFGLDEYNNRVIEFKYYGAFPTSLGGITYSDRDPSELESTFDFVYSQFEVNLL